MMVGDKKWIMGAGSFSRYTSLRDIDFLRGQKSNISKQSIPLALIGQIASCVQFC